MYLIDQIARGGRLGVKSSCQHDWGAGESVSKGNTA